MALCNLEVYAMMWLESAFYRYVMKVNAIGTEHIYRKQKFERVISADWNQLQVVGLPLNGLDYKF